MINFTASNTKLLTATIALFAVVGSACGTAATSSNAAVPGTVAEAAVPAEVAGAADTADAPNATSAEPAAPVAEQPAAQPDTQTAPAPEVDEEQYYNEELTSRQLIPASGFSFPCDSYYEETEYPLMPCSKGELVENFQSIMNYVDPDFVVDGYFGEDTYDAVTGLQSSFSMYQTGIIDDVLLEMIDQSIFHDDPEESFGD